MGVGRGGLQKRFPMGAHGIGEGVAEEVGVPCAEASKDSRGGRGQRW